MNSKPLIQKLFLMLLPLIANNAMATPITYDFTGSISVLSNLSGTGPVAGFALGDAISGTLTYDSGVELTTGFQTSRAELELSGGLPAAPGDVLDPGEFYFHSGMDATADSVTRQAVGGAGLFSLSFSSAGGNFAINPSTSTSFLRHRTNEFIVTPDRPTYAFDTMFASQFDLVTDENIGLRLMDDDAFAGLFPVNAGAQSLAALPSLADLFLARVFGSTDLDGDGVADVQVFATIDSLTAVPEPAPLTILALGLCTLMIRRRRQELRA